MSSDPEVGRNVDLCEAYAIHMLKNKSVKTTNKLFCSPFVSFKWSLPKNVAEYVNKVVHPGVGDFPAKYPFFPLRYTQKEWKGRTLFVVFVGFRSKSTNNKDLPNSAKRLQISSVVYPHVFGPPGSGSGSF